MEKQFKENQLAGRLMKEAGLEKPSLNFGANVMRAINAKQEVPFFRPLMPATGWIILSVMLVLYVIGLYYTNKGFIPLPEINYNFNYNFAWTFPTIEVSQTMSLAICCLLLFLLQIPFLKSLIEREYKA